VGPGKKVEQKIMARDKQYRAERRPGPRIMEQFKGIPFAHNGHGRNGIDCMGLIHAYLSEMGTEGLVDEFCGITLNNYSDFYRMVPREAFQVLIDLFDILGSPVEVNAKIAGDIVLIKRDDGTYFPGIYAGNSNVMVATEGIGVRVRPIGKNMQIIKARRP
jgi:hypothetical protein